MNRKLLYIIALICTSSICIQMTSAQSLKASFGLKGGGVATIMPAPQVPEVRDRLHFGGYGGLFLGLKYGEIIGFQAEVDYSFQGAKYQHNSYNDNYEFIGVQDVKTSQQYIQIPLVLQISAGRVVVFEVGYQQSILIGSSFSESEGDSFSPDPGAHKYYGSIIGGVRFNLGKVIFLNLRHTYGISHSYSIYNKAGYSYTFQLGIGFRIYNSKRSIYK